MSCSGSSPASSGASAAGWKVPTCRAWSCGGRSPRPRASMPRKSPRRARNPISPQSCAARASPPSRRSAEMEPHSEPAMLWHDLKQNLLAGTRLALFLPVRALDFRISIGRYVALVFASLAFWLVGGMLRTGFPGTVDFGALTAALAFGLFAGLLAIFLAVFPRTELWIPARDDRDEAARPRLTEEEVFHRQGILLDEQLAALSPDRRGVVDLYFVGVAGDGKQDTFYSEMVSIKDLLDERFDTAGRSIGLVNNPATLKDYPIATVSNLRSTLAHLGNTINTDEDVVLLHIATHGSDDYRLALDLPPLELAQLTPTVLARMFADSGIKWKVIVISACFSGGFIEPLKDDNTLIITAADAFHSSFGCEYDSDYTWFSQAFYDEALSETFSFVEAFEAAKEAVGDRERAEGYPPSNPPMSIGGAMRKKPPTPDERLAARGADPFQRSRPRRGTASGKTIVVAKGR